MIKNKEIRDLLFIAVAIFMAILICVTSITSGGMFGILVSIMLLALLCVGLGYLYCKNEDKIFVGVEKAEKEKPSELPKIDLGKLGELSAKVGAEKKAEVGKVENDS